MAAERGRFDRAALRADIARRAAAAFPPGSIVALAANREAALAAAASVLEGLPPEALRGPRFLSVLTALNAALRDLEKAHGVRLPRPSAPQSLPKPQLLRTAEWARQAHDAWRWRRALIETCAEPGLSDERMAGAILASAALHDALLRPEAWVALAQALAAEAVPLLATASLPDAPWMPLRVALRPGQKRATNLDPDEDAELLRYMPGAFTLGLILRWTRRRSGSWQAPDTPGTAFALMRRALGLGDGPTARKDATRFAAIAFAPLEEAPGVALPQCLIEIALGRLPSLSMTEDAWAALWRRPAPANVSVALARRPNAPRARRAALGREFRDRDFVAEIQAAIRAPKDGAKKETSAAMRKALAALPDRDLWPSPAAFVFAWLDHLLKRNAPSTVRRYYSAVGRHVVAIGVELDVDLAGLDADGLALFYGAVVEHFTESDESYPLQRLGELHRFGMTHGDFMLPEVAFDFQGEGRRPQVRARIVGKAVVDAVVAAIEASPELSPEERELYALAAILLFRTGLRPEELMRLTAGEVEDGHEAMIVVRDNNYRDLKTSAARRLVPVMMLLDPAERARFEKFRAERRAEAGHSRRLFLARAWRSGDAFDRPIESARLTALIASGLRSATGVETLTVYALRHSALSLLFLALTTDGPDVEALTGWDAGQIAALRRYFLGAPPNPMRLLREVSRLGGHREPATTTNSYVHLADYALHRRVAAARWTLPRNTLASCFALRPTSLLNLAGSAHGDTSPPEIAPESCRAGLVALLRPRLIAERSQGTATPARALPPAAPPSDFAVADSVLRVLERWQGPESLSGIADDTNLDARTIAAIVARAEALLALRTQKRGPRVAHPVKRDLRLAPDGLHDRTRRDGARRVFDALSALPLQARVRWVEAALLCADREHPGARFTDPTAAAAFIAAVRPALRNCTWRADVRFGRDDPIGDALRAAWKSALGLSAQIAFGVSQARHCQDPMGRALITPLRDGVVHNEIIRSGAFLRAVADDAVWSALQPALFDDRRNRRRRNQRKDEK
jgi:integrase